MKRHIKGSYKAKGEVYGGDMEVTLIRPVGTPKGTQSWVAELNAGPTRYRPRRGADMETMLGGRLGYRLVLRPTKRSFRIVRLYQEPL